MEATKTATTFAETPSESRRRRFLMCPPAYFDVVYVINPWMDPVRPVSRDRALQQWETLRATYEAHGHQVETIAPELGLPDMVYAANSGFVMDGTALLSRFRYQVRRGEEPAYARWFAENGFVVKQSTEIHEGEGDFAPIGDAILAATGFRTSPGAHAEAATAFGRPVTSLALVDPRFYHLDMALCVLDAEQIMYYPEAFSDESQARLKTLFPEAIVADDTDALAFGLNATSDGHHVFLAAQAEGLARRLAQAGFEPVPVDLSELRRGGGSVKCCTLELRGDSAVDVLGAAVRSEQAGPSEPATQTEPGNQPEQEVKA